MSEDGGPDWNIAGDDETPQVPGDAGDDPPETRAEAVVDRLGEMYWRKAYGGQDAFECLVRTILSQNTSDAASQPAFEAFLETYQSDGEEEFVAAVARAPKDEIAGVIQPAGLHNQKAAMIKTCAQEIQATYGGGTAFDSFVRSGDRSTVRDTLLEFDGVGPKTADCVLLFAGGQTGVFPVDTHVYRLYRRLGIAPPDADHETVREILEDDVPPEKCGFGHTASIQFGREYCTAGSPACLDGSDACPLIEVCDQVGVDPQAQTVNDPADTIE